MEISGLQEQKKELKSLNKEELLALCLRMSKYKKENKELLNYLLFYQHDTTAYLETLKQDLEAQFNELNTHPYYCAKSLRKILRTISRQAKYISQPYFEADLLLWFCHQYLDKVNLKNNNKSLQGLLIRPLEKIEKINRKLHEDLQFDIQQELDKIHNLAQQRTTWFRL
jgi:hypothetical protein